MSRHLKAAKRTGGHDDDDQDQERIATQRQITTDALGSRWLHPEGPRGTLAVPETFLRGIRRPQCFNVAGDCLTPLGIVDGDSVLVDAANTSPRHGEIVACALNGRLLLKAYLCERPATVRLGFCEDGDYYGIPIAPTDTLEIIGVVAFVVPTGRRVWPAAEVGYPQVRGVRDLPYWQIDKATQEWVHYFPGGAEMERRPLAAGTGDEVAG